MIKTSPVGVHPGLCTLPFSMTVSKPSNASSYKNKHGRFNHYVINNTCKYDQYIFQAEISHLLIHLFIFSLRLQNTVALWQRYKNVKICDGFLK